MRDSSAGEAFAPGISRLALPDGALPGSAVLEGLLARWEKVWVKRELERWATQPPSDQDFMLWGPYRDWSFGRLYKERPPFVRWALLNLNRATCGQQEKRFLDYVERRVGGMEAQGGAGSAAGRALEGGNRALGAASAPEGSSSEDGGAFLMLEDQAWEMDDSSTQPADAEGEENYLHSHRHGLQG